MSIWQNARIKFAVATSASSNMKSESPDFQSFQQSITTGILPLISYTLNNSKIHYRCLFIGLNVCNSYSKQMTMRAAVVSSQQLKETPNSSPALFICFIALNTIIIRFEATVKFTDVSAFLFKVQKGNFLR